MSMTKKDYEAVARAMNISACNYNSQHKEQAVIYEIADDLAKEFKRDNSRFNRDKFIEAVFKR